MEKWRLIPIEIYDAYMNMAIDEAIFRARIEGKAPNTIRFYRWQPSAVSVGRFQRVEKEVYVKNCKKIGIDIVRRISGGGTVYHDSQGEITYSVIASKNLLGTQDVAVIYRKICGGLIEALKILGLNADFSPGSERQCPNIVVNGKKISGSAQAHSGNVVLQHGTLLLDVDLDRMFNLLRVPWAKSVEDVVCVAQNKITSLKHELGFKPKIEDVYSALVSGFEKALNADFSEGSLSDYETGLAEKLRREKFSSNKWNFEGEYKFGLTV